MERKYGRDGERCFPCMFMITAYFCLVIIKDACLLSYRRVGVTDMMERKYGKDTESCCPCLFMIIAYFSLVIIEDAYIYHIYKSVYVVWLLVRIEASLYDVNNSVYMV